MTDAPASAEPHEIRLKRLRMRSWRRGTREMDLLLGGYADGALAGLDAAALDAYEQLLEEPDQELYLWVSGARDPDPAHVPTITAIQSFHNIA
ncbi:MAG: succinate dehydrogenase assembly factor 2 [Pseudomonadota bacterium]